MILHSHDPRPKSQTHFINCMLALFLFSGELTARYSRRLLLDSQRWRCCFECFSVEFAAAAAAPSPPSNASFCKLIELLRIVDRKLTWTFYRFAVRPVFDRLSIRFVCSFFEIEYLLSPFTTIWKKNNKRKQKWNVKIIYLLIDSRPRRFQILTDI